MVYAIKRVKRLLTKCEYKGVYLNDKRLKKQYTDTRDLFLSIPNDSLLHGFRTRAGLNAPGKSLGYAYEQDIWHIFGQLLSAYAKMYMVENDVNILNKAELLMDEWAKSIEPDGYFYYTKNPNAMHYIYEKMTGGLVDMYCYAGCSRAIGYLERITDWAVKNLDRRNRYAHNYGSGPTEWYTLPENLYRAYETSGNIKFKEFGDIFLYNDYFDLFYTKDYDRLAKLAEESEWKRYHAYSHVNCLNSAAMAYKVTGDEKYLAVIKNAYEFLKETQLFATGGFGPSETFILHEGCKKDVLYSEKFHFETPCGSWAVFKLAGHLLELTGEAAYGDWMEQMLYNGIGAALPVDENGMVMYASDYNINGAQKHNTTFGWVCCTGTYPNAVTEYHNIIYYANEETIYVNQYVESSFKCNIKDLRAMVELITEYPVKDSSEITLTLPESESFSIAFRIPGWCNDGFTVYINEAAVNYEISAGWAIINRLWNNQDKIIIKIPMEIKLNPVEKAAEYPFAVSYGPVVLAAVGEKRPIIDERLNSCFDKRIARSTNDKLDFIADITNNESITLKPYYELAEGQNYYLYLSPMDNSIFNRTQLTYGPDNGSWSVDTSWFSDGLNYITKNKGAWFKMEFNGIGIRLTGSYRDNGGIMEIYIDGRLVDKADQYAPVGGVPWFWEKNGLTAGHHIIKAIFTGDSNSPMENKNSTEINIKHITVL